MKNPRFKNYIYWGTTALAVVACSVAFGFFLSRFEIVSRAVGKIVSNTDAHYLRGCAGLPDAAHL